MFHESFLTYCFQEINRLSHKFELCDFIRFTAMQNVYGLINLAIKSVE